MSYEPKRLCPSCREMKYALDWTGHGCRDCYVAYHRAWKQSAHGKALIRKHNEKAQREKRAMVLLAAARSRARKKGVAFEVTSTERERLQSVINGGVCELSGLPFNMTVGESFYRDSPSLDRIKPELGYVDGNLRVILYGLNAAIGSWGLDRLMEMIDAIRSRA